ncbi:MAG: DUF4325 domain-containing protein [Pseudomonadota bacterium]
MKIELKKYGKILVSRPAGKEAANVFKAYSSPKNAQEKLEIDFTGVMVVAPSWLDEFINELQASLSNRLVFLPSKNASVIESLKIIQNDQDQKSPSVSGKRTNKKKELKEKE